MHWLGVDEDVVEVLLLAVVEVGRLLIAVLVNDCVALAIDGHHGGELFGDLARLDGATPTTTLFQHFLVRRGTVTELE